MPADTPPDERARLRADCSRCAALCCVGPAFAASADFAIDKPAGQPCPNLRGDNACSIHDRLRDRGFGGCVAFDCFGAGQQVVQVTFGGRDWRDAPEVAASMFTVLPVVRQLHEARWYLAEAASVLPDGPLRQEAEHLADAARDRGDAAADVLAALDTDTFRRQVGELLSRVSATVRADAPGPRVTLTGADLAGGDLTDVDLRGAVLRGACLIGADLRGADLDRADLLGADLRGADVRGALLADALFLTPPQVDAATGDAATTLPRVLARPPHWPAT